MAKCYFTPPHSTYSVDIVGLRVDVGIDPYIEAVGAFHSTYSSVSVRFGRLVAAPTGYPVKFVHEVVTHAIVVNGHK